MISWIKVILCGIIYFLVVYLFIIRREARPIVPWTVCIISQVICAVFFYNLKDYCSAVLPAPFGMVVPSAILCFGNIGLILLMFGHVMTVMAKKTAEPVKREEIRVAPITVAPMTANRQKPAAEDDGDAAITISYIRKMIADGRRDEAYKFLKMLAFYGGDEQTRAEASELLAQLEAAAE